MSAGHAESVSCKVGVLVPGRPARSPQPKPQPQPSKPKPVRGKMSWSSWKPHHGRELLAWSAVIGAGWLAVLASVGIVFSACVPRAEKVAAVPQPSMTAIDLSTLPLASEPGKDSRQRRPETTTAEANHISVPSTPPFTVPCGNGACRKTLQPDIAVERAELVRGNQASDDKVPESQVLTGTSVAFVKHPPDAFKRAARENKLVFMIHLSGNFEDQGFT